MVAVKHHAADSLLRLKTENENKSLLDDKVPILTISPKSFAWADMTETSEFETILETQHQFVFCNIISVNYLTTVLGL